MDMDVRSELNSAEIQIRRALEYPPGKAMSVLLDAYYAQTESGKDSFVAALIGHFVLRREA
jgi:hypothetical protein